jgi:hypothetical protein
MKSACLAPAPEIKKASFLSRLFSRRPNKPQASQPALGNLAEFGISIFRELATKACEYRLPMILDY